MTTERKILIILAVVIIAMSIFGFKNKEHYDYSDGKGPGFDVPRNFGDVEYAVTSTNSTQHGWNNNNRMNQVEVHLNDMGARGWTLVSVQPGTFSDGYTFFFMRPADR